MEEVEGHFEYHLGILDLQVSVKAEQRKLDLIDPLCVAEFFEGLDVFSGFGICLFVLEEVIKAEPDEG